MTMVNFRNHQHPKGIQETYFKCQHCNKRYTCYVTNQAVRAKQREIKNLTGLNDADERTKLQQEVNQCMDELKSELTNDGT
jgi:hypothetical protein